MLELKQTQRLAPVLTQQLQQAIKLLQLSQLELTEVIEQELKENPILEAEEKTEKTENEGAEESTREDMEMLEYLDRFTSSEEYIPREDKNYPDYENIVTKTSNLRDYLRWQAGLSNFDRTERVVAEWIIENIDDNGYLAYPVIEIARSSGYGEDQIEGVLRKIQKFDPAGVGARTLQECVLLQYETRGEKDPVFEHVVRDYFDFIEKINLKEIVKKTGYTLEDVKYVLEKLKDFDPKPGRNYSDEHTFYIVPDVYVVRGEDGFEVYLNDDDVPELRMSRHYVELYLGKDLDRETRRYIRKKMKQAEWFIKTIEQRHKTLLLVATSIVKFQNEFFEKGVRFLKPLILKDVAQDVDVHESTVSRVTTGKYMSTQHGLFELKFFFPTGIDMEEGDQLSTGIVKDFILELVKGENKSRPLTDEGIASILKNRHGVIIARRTVAKYREQLNIRSSRERAMLYS